MEKRIHQVKVRLTDSEHTAFKRAVSASGIKQSAYLRHIIAGRVPQPKPPPDVYELLKELRMIGRNINQLAAVANASGSVALDRLEEIDSRLDETILGIMDAVMKPRRIK
jgi:hypothetical protein